MARDPVLIHARNAVDASNRYGVPASVILGVLSVEAGTDANGRPVRPGDGLGPPSYGQFTYRTGRALGIVYGDSRSETFGVARYLSELGYAKDPERAIGAYNGGPANPQYDYAAKVLAAAKSRYAGFDTGSGSSATSTSTSTSASTSASDTHGTLVRVGVVGVLVLGGVAMVTAGVMRATGVRGRLSQIAGAAA